MTHFRVPLMALRLSNNHSVQYFRDYCFQISLAHGEKGSGYRCVQAEPNDSKQGE